MTLRHDKTRPPRPKIGPWINDQKQGATTVADEQKNAPTAANLAESLRDMRRSAGRHMATRGGMQWSVVLDDIRIGDLSDAADLIEVLEMALNAERAQRITLQHHAADIAEELRMMRAGRDAALAEMNALSQIDDARNQRDRARTELTLQALSERDAARADVERLLDALKEIGGRIKSHPAYEELRELDILATIAAARERAEAAA